MWHWTLHTASCVMCLSCDCHVTVSCALQILQQTTVTEQTDGAAAGDRPTGSSVSMRKKAEERNFLSLVPVPNPYSLFQK